MEIIFRIPGEPFGKQRPKFSGRGGFVRTYTPKDTVEYEKLVAEEYKKAGGVLFDPETPISITVFSRYLVPKSASKIKKVSMLVLDTLPTKKPDFDNIEKVIADGLNGVAYADDKQICHSRHIKTYADEPEVVVVIHEVAESEKEWFRKKWADVQERMDKTT